MELKPGYKQTEVGMIPEEWEVKPLGSILSKGPLGGNYANQDHETSCPLMKMGNIARGHMDMSKVEYILAGITPDRNDKLQYGDVLFNTRNTLDLVGKVAIWRDELPVAYYNSNLMRLEFDTQEICSTEYANYSLNSAGGVARLRALATGTTSVAAIYTRDLLGLPFIVPPPSEQRAIAAALGGVDALIGALDRLIAKKRDLKQAAIQQLLTGQTRLPGFSGEWELKRFGDLFQFLNTANNPRADLTPLGDFGYIHYGDIHTTASVFLDCSVAALPQIEKTKVANIPLVEDGDLVMADASEDYKGLGKSLEIRNVNGQKIVAGLHTFLLRGNRDLMTDGFKSYLQFFPSVRAAMVRFATGISVYGLSKSNVKNIEVFLPRVDEQTAITAVLSDMDAEIAALEARRDKTRALKQGMMQELLTGRTRLL